MSDYDAIVVGAGSPGGHCAGELAASLGEALGTALGRDGIELHLGCTSPPRAATAPSSSSPSTTAARCAAIAFSWRPAGARARPRAWTRSA